MKVSLRNSKNAETVTDGVEYQKITVDAISPTADFKDLGNAGQFNKVLPNNWKGFGNFSKDKIKKYLVTSDDATSKVKSLKTCKITVDNDDAEAIVEKISEAVKNDSVWEETSSVETSSVKFDKEGNYIVLALVEDNVGNKAVYASNGLVFDLTAPDVSVKIIEPEENTGCNQKVNFTVEINDKDISSIDIDLYRDGVIGADGDLERQVGRFRRDAFASFSHGRQHRHSRCARPGREADSGIGKTLRLRFRRIGNSVHKCLIQRTLDR